MLLDELNIYGGGRFKENTFVIICCGMCVGGGRCVGGKYNSCVWFVLRVFHFHLVDW